MSNFIPLIRPDWRRPVLTAFLAALGSAASAQTVDGTRDASYPAALAVQTVNTDFGNSTSGSQTLADGCELDNIHARIVGSNLYLFIGGNLQANFNKLDLFFDSQAGGQNQLNSSASYLTNFNGLKFDAGFTADYAMSVTCGNNFDVYANYTPVPATGADFIGGGGGRTQAVNFGLVLMGAGTGTVSIDNSNVAGVSGGTGAASAAAAAAVATGIEYKIPLSALGTTQYGGDIKIAVMINGSSWDYLSNQTLGGLPAGQGNLGGDNNGTYTGNVGGVDFTAKAGNQYVTVLNSSPVVDGTLDLAYAAALAVQTVETQFGDNSTGSQTQAGGSELDNIHAEVFGNDLYVFVGGNMESSFNKLTLFFDSKSGGQNQLAGNAGFVGNMNGLKFDAGFTADYSLAMGAGNNPLEVYTNYSALPGTATNFTGGGVGRTQAINFSTVVPGAGTGSISIDNSNVAGVAGGTGAANQVAAEAVATGIEYRIPLTALGAVTGGGDIKITAFISDGGWGFLSNQVLAGVPAGTSNLGGPGGVDFSAIGGNQFVTVVNGGGQTASQISVAPQQLNFYNVSTTGGSVTRTVAVTNNGDASLSVTSISSSNPAFTLSTTTLTVAPGITQNVIVTFDPSVGGTSTATISFASNDPNRPTETITATGTGIAPGQIIVDGTRDATLYGPARAVQTNTTGFGNSNTGQAGTANGSELDAAYSYISGGYLYVMLAGNLETNTNKLVLFFDTSVPGGQQTYLASNPTVDFGNSGNLAGLQFDAGFKPEYLLSINQGGSNVYANFLTMDGSGGNGQYLTPSVNDLTAPLDFGGGVLGEISINNSNTAGVSGAAVGSPAAVTTGVELRIPLAALGSPSPTAPIRVMAMIASGDYSFLSNQFLGAVAGGTANLGNPNAANLSTATGQQFFTAQRGNVTISTAEALSGEFQNVNVTGTGALTVADAFDAAGLVTVQTGGELNFSSTAPALTGGGSFTMQTGATLRIGSAAGITSSGATGNIQLTGTRSYSTGGIYYYTGGTSRVTGNGLPATVRELVVSLPNGSPVPAVSGVSLSQSVSVSQALRVINANLSLGANTLSILSSAAGTALVENANGTVLGASAEMQCYLNPSFQGRGYRHYSSPTAGMTVGDLAATGFTPVVNPLYNTTPNPSTPGAVVPFPNVFYFDETLATTDFNAGYRSPDALGDALTVAEGYTVNLFRTPRLTFDGTLNTGSISTTLTRTGNTSTSGFNLKGNPYPSPIDWDLMTIPAGMSGQVSVIQPAANATSNGGSYLTYNNGVGSLPGGIVPAMQGMFLLRTTAGSGTLTFSDAARVTTFDPSLSHYRVATETRPLVRLDVNGVGALAGLTDAAFVYFENGATHGFDTQYDAQRVGHSLGDSPTISTILAGGIEAQIDGRPVLTQDLTIPLLMEVGRTGTYQMNASTLVNFAAGQPVLLEDAVTGTSQDLTQNPTYTFTMDAAFRGARFTLHFPAGRVSGLNAAAADALLSVYPNPSNGTCTLEWTGAQPLTGTVTLVDALGRTVRQLAAASRLTLSDLPKGVYTLRATTSTGPLTRRLVVE